MSLVDPQDTIDMVVPLTRCVCNYRSTDSVARVCQLSQREGATSDERSPLPGGAANQRRVDVAHRFEKLCETITKVTTIEAYCPKSLWENTGTR